MQQPETPMEDQSEDLYPGRWMSDKESDNCLNCMRKFEMFDRRHHCRRCGGIFCNACSKMKCLIPLSQAILPPDQTFRDGNECDEHVPQRVCERCYDALLPLQPELQETIARSSMPIESSRSSMTRFLNAPIQMTMQEEIKKATNTLWNFTQDNSFEGEDTIPSDLLAGCCGIAFITVIKAGFFFSGQIGTGCMVARLGNGEWSAPNAIAMGNFGWGFQIGGELTDYVIILNSKESLESFMGKAQVTLGTELGISVGPLGRTAATDLRAGAGGVAAAFAYAHSRGLFAGVSLEAGVMMNRPDVNESFYGRRLSTREILTGEVQPPPSANILYQALREVEYRLPTSSYAGGEAMDPNDQLARDEEFARQLYIAELEQYGIDPNDPSVRAPPSNSQPPPPSAPEESHVLQWSGAPSGIPVTDTHDGGALDESDDDDDNPFRVTAEPAHLRKGHDPDITPGSQTWESPFSQWMREDGGQQPQRKVGQNSRAVKYGTANPFVEAARQQDLSQSMSSSTVMEEPTPVPPSSSEPGTTQEVVQATEEGAPSAQDSAPVTAESAPNTQESTPATAESAPNTQESTPATEESAPNTQESTPATEESAPNTQESTPATEESAPNTQESVPSAEEEKAVSEVSQKPGEPAQQQLSSSNPFTDDVDEVEV